MIECKNFVRLRILYKSLDQSWLVGLWFKLSVDLEYIYIYFVNGEMWFYLQRGTIVIGSHQRRICIISEQIRIQLIGSESASLCCKEEVIKYRSTIPLPRLDRKYFSGCKYEVI